jgi:hypothetical protein
MRLTPLFLLVLATPLAAQVGHGPSSSPYQDIPRGKSLWVFYGDVAGDGGRIRVGPHNGQSYGLRFDLQLSAPLQFGISVSRAQLERFVVSADDSVANRVDGPVDQSVTMFEAAVQLNLTGRKAWHHLAPFVGGSLGYADGSGLPSSVADSSGYDFGGRLYLAPAVGLRVLVGKSLHLRLEARQLFWQLKYPARYTFEPQAEPSTDPDNPNAVLPDGKRDEWSGARELRVGLGFTF